MVAKRYALLLGAGASHGAGRIWPFAPPLGRDLFPYLARAYPQTWGRVPPDTVPLFERSFEEGMSLPLARYDELGSELMIDMARYFSIFQVPPDSSDALSSLVAGLASESSGRHVTFATLNYDRLIETALNSFGLPYAYHPSELVPGVIPVWKLHGSCNFLPDLQGGRVIGSLFKGNAQIYAGRIRVVALEPSVAQAALRTERVDAVNHCSPQFDSGFTRPRCPNSKDMD